MLVVDALNIYQNDFPMYIQNIWFQIEKFVSTLCQVRIDSVTVPVCRLDGKAETEVVGVGSPDAGSNPPSSPRPIDKADSSPGKHHVASYSCTPDTVVLYNWWQ